MIPASPSPPPSPPPAPAVVSVEDEYSPSYYGESGSSNLINLRAEIPYDGSAYVLRVKLPIVTSAPTDSITGAGDLAVTDLAVIDGPLGSWVGGLTFRFPTANDSLGTHKYSLGPAFGYSTSVSAWTLGVSTESYFSIIGPSSYPSVGKSQISPTLRCDLGDGWSIGLSTMQFTYDWTINRWTDVPFGLRFAKRGIGGLRALGAYVEGERNLVHAADTPGWTMRAALQWIFTR